MSIFRARLVALIIPVVVWAGSVPIAEIVFRALGGRPSDDFGGVYQPFGDGSYRMRPDVDSRMDWASGAFWVSTDGLGLRCDRSRGAGLEADAAIEVLILGDSQAFGLGVEFEDSVAGVIWEEAGTGGYAVANASVAAHLLLNQLELARHLHEERGLDFDVVLVLATPRLIALGGVSTRQHVGEDGRLYGSPPGWLTRARVLLGTNSVAYLTCRTAYRSLRPAPPAGAGPRDFYADDPARAAHLLTTMEQMKAWCDEIGVTLVMVYLPLTLEFDPAFAAPSLAGGPSLSMLGPSASLRAAADTLNVPMIDTRPVLAELHESGAPLHLSSDFHYNPDTSRAVGNHAWNELARMMQLNFEMNQEQANGPRGD